MQRRRRRRAVLKRLTKMAQGSQCSLRCAYNELSGMLNDYRMGGVGMFMKDAGASEPLCRVSIESLDSLTATWHDHRLALRWTCPFVLPPWLNAWWKVFGRDAEPLVAVVRQDEAIVGIAPLMLQDKVVRFLGGSDVCDYFDCAVVPGKEDLFFASLVGYLSSQGLKDLDLGPARPDAIVQKLFSESGPFSSIECDNRREDISVELDLPATWDEFLGSLNGKQRHELRRKLRRLHESGPVRFRLVDDMTQIPEAVETFLAIFTMNRKDKAEFMTGRMASFFRSLSFALAEEGLLRLFFLDVDQRPVASVFCFDHQGTRYLYNSGYDDGYQEISVGLMSKVLSLKAAIDEGLRTYDFLKGSEEYKYRLGGKGIPLSRCHVTIR
jgi:CelD/BcsL family acetyltransferase involved in cellulose biosynthesis